MINPKVSVIIPVYNTEVYIEDSLRCIMNQTLKELEIIVVNDGSTDNSLDIINKIAKEDERIQVYSQKNQGQSVARNVGMEMARGEFFYFMDSDDLLVADALEVCFNKCCEQEADFVFFDGDILYEGNRPALSWDYHRTNDFDEKEIYVGISLFNRMLDTSTHRAVPWLLLIRSSFMNNIRLKFYPGIIHEDELFTVILYLKAMRVGCIKRSFAKHRVRSSSTMTTKYSYRNVDCYFTVITQLLGYAQTKDILVRRVVDKYVSYTLNPVFQTAFSLPLKDRLKIILVAMRHNYLKYIHAKNMLILLFKNYISPSTKRQRLD